ncbi:MAG TPA: HAMP domain-containing sensor histidine kinase, partial [Aggregatilineales bacterium]|nr:HAMP domain-containing sensor histidine kinase [Aggregatilineales bacterium]
FDRLGRLILANPEAHNVGLRLGISLYSHIGETFAEISQKLPDTISLSEVMQGGDSMEINFGKAGEFVIRIAEVPGLKKEVDSYVVVGQEVTGERQLNRSRSELLHVLSHDLGNTLSQALGYTDLLLTDTDEKDQIGIFVRRVYDALVQGKSLIRDVVEIEYAETQGVRLDKPFDIATLMEQVVQGLIVVAELKEQSLTYELSHDPQRPLIGNRSLVRQALENLVSNAIKYTPDGGQVLVRLDTNGAGVKISVSDNGIGIPADEQANIWERFYRVKSMETEGIQGTGLGLNLVRSVIESHDGRVSVESAPGRGSIFRVWLPYAPVEPEK